MIDLDDRIKEAKAAAKAAAKSLAQARTQSRVERKRRAHLVRKAGQLSAQDLERIAVLKRTGWWHPSSGEAIVPAISEEQEHQDRDSSVAGGAKSVTASSSGSGSSTGANATGRANPVSYVTARTGRVRRVSTDDHTVAEDEDGNFNLMPDDGAPLAIAQVSDLEQEQPTED